MDSRTGKFRTGNSGNLLRQAVVKTGPGCQQEGIFCEYLGTTVAPEIYTILPDGYVMECLHPIPVYPRILQDIEATLEKEVWSRPALPISTEISWQEKLLEFGVGTPYWAVETDSCLVHGDPTMSNALHRLSSGRIELILADPRPPRDFIPQARETDMGRILQSYFGWESAAYGVTPPFTFSSPKFFKDYKLYRAAQFWCGAAAARIQFLEKSRGNRPNILRWCKGVREVCGV